MPRITELPADQRAVLQLVLRQGRSYDELAGLLKIGPEAVRDRAHSGAGAVAPSVEDLDPGRRGQVTDYLLGQQTVSERAATRRFLAGDPSARAWARGLAVELAPLAPGGLPEIPEGDGSTAATGADAEPAAPLAADEPALAAASTSAEDDRYARVMTRGGGGAPRSSKLGGALILAGLGILVLVLVLVLATGAGDDSNAGDGAANEPATSRPQQPTDTPQASGQALTPVAQVNLRPPAGGNAAGIARLVTQGQGAGFIVQAQGLEEARDTFHIVWLTGKGATPMVIATVPNGELNGGKFSGVAQVPQNTADYDTVVISRESNSPQLPTKPSRPVLTGALDIPDGALPAG